MSSPPGDRHRVLILIKGLGIGGAESLIGGATAFWDRSRYDYRVAYLLPWKNQLSQQIGAAGVTVNCVDLTGPADMSGLQRLRRLVSETDPDLIHSHLPVAGILGRMLKGRARHVYTEHNVVGFYRQPTRTTNRLTYGRNDAVIAVSQSVADSVAGYPGPEPQVIPNGVVVPDIDQNTRMAARTELGIDQETPLVVHVGNIRPHKGHENLTHAVARLARDHPQVVVVSIGGEKNEGDLNRVRKTAADLGTSDRLIFLGRRSDAQSFLAAADLAVNPSDVEGLPLFVLEALALGKPVVATDVGGVSSVVKNHETGLLVPPGDPAQLADAIATALHSDQREEWGRAGADLIARGYGLAGMVSRYEDLYTELLG